MFHSGVGTGSSLPSASCHCGGARFSVGCQICQAVVLGVVLRAGVRKDVLRGVSRVAIDSTEVLRTESAVESGADMVISLRLTGKDDRPLLPPFCLSPPPAPLPLALQMPLMMPSQEKQQAVSLGSPCQCSETERATRSSPLAGRAAAQRRKRHPTLGQRMCMDEITSDGRGRATGGCMCAASRAAGVPAGVALNTIRRTCRALSAYRSCPHSTLTCTWGWLCITNVPLRFYGRLALGGRLPFADTL